MQWDYILIDRYLKALSWLKEDPDYIVFVTTTKPECRRVPAESEFTVAGIEVHTVTSRFLAVHEGQVHMICLHCCETGHPLLHPVAREIEIEWTTMYKDFNSLTIF